MKILEKSEEFFSIAGLGIQRLVPIGGKVIPRIALRCFIVSMIALCCVLQGLTAIKHSDGGLTAVLMPVHLGLTYSSALSIYISLVFKTDRIVELLNYLRVVFDLSMF